MFGFNSVKCGREYFCASLRTNNSFVVFVMNIYEMCKYDFNYWVPQGE